jgi:FAD/FMN-containing dehydrogenase
MRKTSLLAVAAPIISLVNGFTQAQQAAIQECLEGAGVPVNALNSTGWNNDVAPFNLRVRYTPIAIAVPATIKHIQDSVACGVKSNLKVNPKSGGHSYASFGLGGENGHLVIQLDRMKSVTVDQDNIATIQAGARLGHVALELFAQGKRAISHGTCPG